MEFWDVVENRHSVRDFEDVEVPREKLMKLLHAASAAPSAMNEQPWRYHVATGGARAEVGQMIGQATVHLTEYMDVLGPKHYEDALRWYSSLGDAPVVIGVSMPSPQSEFDGVNKLLSVGASIENLQLAATAEGLGSCNITFAWWVREDLARLFDVAEGWSVVAVIAIGVPSEVPPVAPPHAEDVADWLE